MLYFCSTFKKLIDTVDADGKTPVHLAMECGMYTRVEALLDDFQAGKHRQ